MALSVGIVGLPNVGKSTLFNALTRAQNAAAENYPFCTIEPNKATVPVPDSRLQPMADLVHPSRIVAATVDFIDIAGLVRGASKGEGLGNQFLGNIREVDAIIHVIRCFDDGDVVHVEGDVDPVRDIGIIDTELLLADMESLEKRIDRIGRQARADKALRAELAAMEELRAHFDAGKPARTFPRDENAPIFNTMHDCRFLTDKPQIYCCNISEDALEDIDGNAYVKAVREYAASEHAPVEVIAARMESELVGMTDEERTEMLESYGLKESGLDCTVRTAYDTLGLISYFTAGPLEVKAWTVRKGSLAPQAAGVIHSDFERGFIRAEVMSWKDLLKYGGEHKCREEGVLRTEGKEYVVQDGDVMHFLFNV